MYNKNKVNIPEITYQKDSEAGQSRKRREKSWVNV